MICYLVVVSNFRNKLLETNICFFCCCWAIRGEIQEFLSVIVQKMMNDCKGKYLMNITLIKFGPFIQKKKFIYERGLHILPILEQISALNLCVAFHHHLLLLTLHCCIYKHYIINPSDDVERQAFQYSRIALEHCLSYILQKMMNAMFNPLCIVKNCCR